jgi:hypothetical protein
VTLAERIHESGKNKVAAKRGRKTVRAVNRGSIRIEYTPFRCRQKDNALECVMLLLSVKVGEVCQEEKRKLQV